MNPVTRALNGGGPEWAIWLGRLLIAVVPVLMTTVGFLFMWVVELRSTVHTVQDHAKHMEVHAEGTLTPVSTEVLRELERINQRLSVVERHILKASEGEGTASANH